MCLFVAKNTKALGASCTRGPVSLVSFIAHDHGFALNDFLFVRDPSHAKLPVTGCADYRPWLE